MTNCPGDWPSHSIGSSSLTRAIVASSPKFDNVTYQNMISLTSITVMLVNFYNMKIGTFQENVY